MISVFSFRFIGAWDLLLISLLAALALCARMLTRSLWQGWPTSYGCILWYTDDCVQDLA